jgi:hypothetical protein
MGTMDCRFQLLNLSVGTLLKITYWFYFLVPTSLGCCGSWIKNGLLFQTCLLLPDFVIMLIFIIKFLSKPRSDLALSIGLLLSSMFHSNDDFVVSA